MGGANDCSCIGTESVGWQKYFKSNDPKPDPPKPKNAIGWKADFKLRVVAINGQIQTDKGTQWVDSTLKMHRQDSTKQNNTTVVWFDTDCSKWPDYHPVPPAPPSFTDKMVCSPNMLVVDGKCECYCPDLGDGEFFDPVSVDDKYKFSSTKSKEISGEQCDAWH